MYWNGEDYYNEKCFVNRLTLTWDVLKSDIIL